MADQKERHVFISYVRENQDQVDHLCKDLESQGVKVWLDRKSIKPGARWKDAIREAIRHGDFFIACFSDEYTSKTKTYMNEELTLATEELRQYASDREWFIPVLLSECDVPARSIGAGETLLDINWVPLYEDWDSGIQRILSVIKPIPQEIQNLINLLRSENSGIRQQAAEAFGKIGPEAQAALPALIEVIKDKDTEVRERVADTLGEIGSEAKVVVPSLIEALKDEDEAVRKQASCALGNIGPKAKAAVPTLGEVLKDTKIAVRGMAAYALIGIGPEANPALIENLKAERTWVRRLAAWALGEIGPEARRAVPALIETLKDKEEKVRGMAAYALEEINTPEA